MTRARIGQLECEVRVTRDLGDNFAVEVAAVEAAPRRSEVYKTSPARLVVKLHATGREAAVQAALQMLKDQGRIDDFTG